VPSVSAVKEYLYKLPEELKMTRGGDFRAWDRQARPRVQYRPTTRANERFQADHARLDIWARTLVDGTSSLVQLWVTALLDDFSRAIPGIAVTAGSANSWSITQALRHAVLPKEEPGWEVCGLPDVFQCDRGADFMSDSVHTALGVLGIRREPDPPHYPNKKGKVERVFATLDQGCLRGLPGHMSAIGRTEGAAKKHLAELLTPEQIEEEIKRWIREEYHQQTHSSTGRKPIESWRETVHLKIPDEGEVFRVLLRMENEVRKVQRVVRFTKNGAGGEYWSPEIPALYGRRVKVAYNPEDMRRVALHCEETGEYLAEPWLLDHPECPHSKEVILKEGRQYRRGLKARIKGHLAKIHELEAEAREDQEWDEAQADIQNEPEPEPEPTDPEEEEVEEILNQMMPRRNTDD
jgi:putative transposase